MRKGEGVYGRRIPWVAGALVMILMVMGPALECAAQGWPVTGGAGGGSAPNYIIYVKVRSPSAKVRSGPGRWYPKMGRIHQNEVYRVLEQQADYYKVQMKDGTYGWVQGHHLQAVSGPGYGNPDRAPSPSTVPYQPYQPQPYQPQPYRPGQPYQPPGRQPPYGQPGPGYAQQGSIVLRADVSGEAVEVDGRYVLDTVAGQWITIPYVAPGSHRLRLQRSGYREWFTRVWVNAGRSTQVDVRMTPNTPWTPPWGPSYSR